MYYKYNFFYHVGCNIFYLMLLKLIVKYKAHREKYPGQKHAAQ